MVRITLSLLVVLGLLIAALPSPAFAQSNPAVLPAAIPQEAVAQTVNAQSADSAYFVEDHSGRFLAQGAGGSLGAAHDGLWVSLRAAEQGVNVQIRFAGANPQVDVRGFDPASTQVSYLGGRQTGAARTWRGVRYSELYPGIHLELRAVGGQFVPQIVAEPGADLSQVRLEVEGAQSVRATASHLYLETLAGKFALPLLRAAAPLSTGFASLGEATAHVAQQGGAFVVRSPFAAAGTSWSSAEPITATVTAGSLFYSTFLGGTDLDEAYALAVDGEGAVYVTGGTVSYNFPATPGAFTPECNDIAFCDVNVFVAKLTPAGHKLEWATYLVGESTDRGLAIAVDAQGAAYVTGQTSSYDFPITSGTVDPWHGGEADAFVVKLSPDGSTLEWGTFLGGWSFDHGYAIAVNADGEAFVTGDTWSEDFPTTTGAYQTALSGRVNGFLARLNPSGTAFIYSTLFGQGEKTAGAGLAITAAGEAYVAGTAWAAGLPVGASAADATFDGIAEAFVVRFNHDGSALEAATWLGGSGEEDGKALAMGPDGDLYIAGRTWSLDFPTTEGAYDTQSAADEQHADAFVARLTPDLTGLTFATYLGGAAGEEFANGLAVDADGGVFVVGTSQSSDFPTTLGAVDETHNGGFDAFLARLSPSGARLTYSTLLGGAATDKGEALALDGEGGVYLAGLAYSADFPTTPGSLRPVHADGDWDGFVAKLVVQTGGAVIVPDDSETPVARQIFLPITMLQ